MGVVIVTALIVAWGDEVEVVAQDQLVLEPTEGRELESHALVDGAEPAPRLLWGKWNLLAPLPHDGNLRLGGLVEWKKVGRDVVVHPTFGEVETEERRADNVEAVFNRAAAVEEPFKGQGRRQVGLTMLNWTHVGGMELGGVQTKVLEAEAILGSRNVAEEDGDGVLVLPEAVRMLIRDGNCRHLHTANRPEDEGARLLAGGERSVQLATGAGVVRVADTPFPVVDAGKEVAIRLVAEHPIESEPN